MFVAAFLSAIPVIVGFSSREQSLFKLLIFPLVWRCIVSKAMDLGLLPTLNRHGDILGYVIVTTIVGFCFSTEGYSN